MNEHPIAVVGPKPKPLNTVGLCPCGFESRLRHIIHLQVVIIWPLPSERCPRGQLVPFWCDIDTLGFCASLFNRRRE